jgi:hypothetical protein
MKRFFLCQLSWVSVLTIFSASAIFASDFVPPCVSTDGSTLPIDNSSALNLEASSGVPNQYTIEAHVEGTITALYPDHSGHEHFAIQLGSDPSQGIEVVYNEDFGNLPALSVGMTVEACGDFVKSNAPAGPYPASPMGAIIHWVHINPSQAPGAHPSGFLVINGQLCGQDASSGGHGA